jgi:hypothetical protein
MPGVPGSRPASESDARNGIVSRGLVVSGNASGEIAVVVIVGALTGAGLETTRATGRVAGVIATAGGFAGLLPQPVKIGSRKIARRIRAGKAGRLISSRILQRERVGDK